MSTKTTNLQLTKPAYGEAADIAVINANMDIIDDTVAGKVTAPSSEVTTDTVAVFDGTTGKLIKSSGFTIGKSVPSNAVFTDTNTKNTTGTTNKTGTKLFLAGATGQSSNPTTYSNSNVYIGTDNALYSNGKQVVNLSDSQALTNKTYNGYTLKDACAKEVDTVVTAGSSKLPTSDAVATAIASSRKIPFCKIGRRGDSINFAVNTVLAVDFGDYTNNLDSTVFSVSQTNGITRINVLKSGWFMLDCTEYIQRSQDGRAQVSVTVSGTQEYIYALNYLNAAANNSVSLQTFCHLDAGDWVAPELWGDGGGTIKLQGGNGRVNHLTLVCLALD